MLSRRLLLLCIFVILCLPAFTAEEPEGWRFPGLGAGRGDWDASVGVFVGPDKQWVRNLQFRGDMDLAHGVRWHANIRSNRALTTLSGFQPHADELYVEGFGFHHAPVGTLSASLRVGTLRYLRFPYPDAIAVFDQVPGVSDLMGGPQTGYGGAVLALDYAHRSGLGAHLTGITWGFGRRGETDVLEGYVNLRHDLGAMHLEARAGLLPVRREPVDSKAGANLFLGVRHRQYQIGVLSERLHGENGFTGLLVQFAPSRVTNPLGTVAFDYARDPEGFSSQLPLLAGTFGDLRRTPPSGGALVGEMTCERFRSFWQNSHLRNAYEHRLAATGVTDGDDLVVVMVKRPRFLHTEAVVSPHTRFGSINDLKRWEADRISPAQLNEPIVYQFYRVKQQP